MVEAAQWVASFLFLAAVAAALGWATWRWRKLVLRALLALAGVVLVVGGGFSLWQRWQEHTAAAAEAEVQQAMRESVSTANVLNAPPVPGFKDVESRLAYLRWLGEMSERLKARIPDWPTRKEFMQTIWYESRRAGLDVSLTLGLVDAMSGFKKFYVAESGARGYFAVNPRWTAIIGDGDPAKLFHMQTNMRFGAVVLRNYLDQSNGDLYRALAQYVADSMQVPADDLRVARAVDAIFAAQHRWVFRDERPMPVEPADVPDPLSPSPPK